VETGDVWNFKLDVFGGDIL